MPEKRSFRQRVQRFRRLWRATSTGVELGYTGPAELAELNPPANRYWITQRLQQADVDRAPLWLAECDLVAVSLLEQAQESGSHTVVGVDRPEQYQPEHEPESVPSPEPVDLDHITGEGRR